MRQFLYIDNQIMHLFVMIVLSFVFFILLFATLSYGQGNNELINREFLNIPSVYSTSPIKVDGYDDDWRTINNYNNNSVSFKGIPLSLPSSSNNSFNDDFSGQILAKNNNTHLAFLIKLYRPIISSYTESTISNSISLIFDEDGDGMSQTGDNYISIMSRSDYVLRSISDSYMDEGVLKEDPISDSVLFDAFLRYISKSEIVLEIVIPYKETNDFYDFQMLVPHLFTFMIGYHEFVGQYPNLIPLISFGNGFSYTMAQDYSIGLLNGIIAILIFIIVIVLSLIIGITILRKKSITYIEKIEKVITSRKIRVISILLLFAIFIIIFINPIVVSDIGSRILLLSNQNFYEIIIYSIALGGGISAISLAITKKALFLLLPFKFDQKFIVISTIILFVIAITPTISTPLLNLMVGIPAILKSGFIVDDIKPHVFAFQDFLHAGLASSIFLPLFYLFSIWLPTLFILYVLYDLLFKRPKLQLKLRKKVFLIFTSLILFILIALWSLHGLFIPSSNLLNYFSLLIGPTISAILLSFLAVEGYIDTIKESIEKILISIKRRRRDQDNINVYDNNTNNQNIHYDNPKIIKRIGSLLISLITLSLSIIGLSKNLFLITIPFVYLEFPLGYSLINNMFIERISDYAILISGGENIDSAQIIYNSALVFFSFFWLYDMIMILKGFGQDYLSSENIVYKKLKKNLSALTGISFICILILFTIDDNFISFREEEVNSYLPSFVKETMGIQINERQLLSNLSSQLGFLTGISTLIGLSYIIIRRRQKYLLPN